MTNSAPEFDPRYDPRFQPGYDPERHAARVEAPAEPRIGERRVPSPPRTAESGRPAASGDDDVVIFEADELTAEAVEQAERENELVDAAPLGPVASLLRNPFLWVIVALGIGLIWWGWSAYAGASASMSNGMFYGFTNEDESMQEYVSAQVTSGLAPLAVLVGMLALVGAVFFAAASWRRVRAGSR